MARARVPHDSPDELPPRNEVHLRGRLAAEAVERELPSGDTVAVFRLVVERVGGSTGARVDTLDCAAFRGDVRQRLRRWRPGDVLELDGALRRRFFRAGAGPASRYEVEVSAARRVASAAAGRRGTMTG